MLEIQELSTISSLYYSDLQPMCPVPVRIPVSVTGIVPFRIFLAEPVSRLRRTEPGSTYDVVNDFYIGINKTTAMTSAMTSYLDRT
jgi:hypothetical protein